MNEQHQNGAAPATPRGWYGPFYYAPEDRRVILPKRWGIGYTFNFARPTSYVVILAVAILPAVVTLAVFLAR